MNQGIDDWELDFSDRSITNNEFGGADRLISVVVSSERGIYALAPSEYSFNTTSDENSGVLTITGIDANKVSGDVSIRAHLAVTAFHREGDVVRYFGDENVQNGQPVVDKVGSEFVIRVTTDGTPIRYTNNTTQAKGDAFELTTKNGVAIKHLRGAPVFDPLNSQWVERTITRAQQNELTVQRYLGNEALIYFGGEQAYNSATDAILEKQVVTRISGLGIPGDIFYTNGIFPNADGNRVVDQDDTFEINLGDGDDTFTLNFTPSSPFTLNTGAGDDRVAVRATEGQATLNLGSGDDLVAVGSQSGLWETTPIASGERASFEPTIENSQFINYLGNLNAITGSVLVNGGSGSDRVTIDETGETVTNTGTLTRTQLEGFGIALGRGVVYNNDDQVEFVDIALGSGDDIVTVESTSSITFTRIEGRSGNDAFNLQSTGAATNIFGDSETGQINVGFRTFDVTPGNDVFRVGSLSASDVPATSVLDTIQWRLRLFGNGTDDSTQNQNSQPGDELIFYNGGTGGNGGVGTLRSDELLGFGMGAGVAYSGMTSLALRLSDGVDKLFVESTHTGETDILGGNEPTTNGGGQQIPGDVINIGSISGDTTVNAQGGNDTIRVNYDREGNQTFLSGVASTLLIDGGNGSDIFEVGLAGLDTATVDIRDTGSSMDNSSDRVRIYGNDDENLFLFRANQASGRGVVASYEVDDALLPVAGGFLERVNYNRSIENIEVDGRGGDDTFVFDDTISGITVRGGTGDDAFQLGQVFESARNGLNPSNGLDPLDYFETTQTTRGFLSNGVSETATLRGGLGNDTFTIYRAKAEIFARGEEGDDNFLVRSFVKVDPNDPKAPFTNINGGQGADFIAFTVNAPVRIEGGDGFDTLTVVGTEFGDDFLVNEFGVFGGGLFITYDGIEKLVVDALEGNDRFFIAGTSEGVEVEIVGGLGSDTFNVGGNDGKPITVVSNSLDGNSGLIDQSILTADENFRNIFLRDLSVKVSDNDEAGILVIQDEGPLTLLEGIDPPETLSNYFTSSYMVVLTRSPEETVRIAATPLQAGEKARRAGAEGIQLGTSQALNTMSAAGQTLFFTRDNWFIPQRVYVYAPDDSVQEGRQTVQIQHKATQGAVPDDGGAYDNLASLGITVDVYDDDVSDLVIVPLDGGNPGLFTQVFEDGSIKNGTDTFAAFLTRAPGANLSIDFTDSSGQLQLQPVLGGADFEDVATLEFTTTEFNKPQVITIQANDDTAKEARHFARIEATLNSGSTRAEFVNVTVDDVAEDFFNTLRGTGEFVIQSGTTADKFFITGPDFDITGTDNFTIPAQTALEGSAAGNRFEFALNNDYAVGDVFTFSVTKSGVTNTVNHAVTAGTDGAAQTAAEVVNAVVKEINDNSGTLGITASALAEVFRVETTIPSTPFTYNFTRQTGATPAVDAATEISFRTVEVTVTAGTPYQGELFSLTITPKSGRGGGTFNYTVGANGEPVTFDRLDVEIADDDTPQVVVNEGNGVVVSEESQEFFLGSGFAGQLTAVPFFEQQESHDTIGSAQSLDGNFYSNAEIPGTSDDAPRIRVIGSGDGLADVYSIEINADNANRNGYLLITNIDGEQNSFAGDVAIFKAGDSQTPITNASAGQTFFFPTAGTYYVKVTSSGSPVLKANENYALDLFVPNKSTVFAFEGSFGISKLPETRSAHDDISTAQDLDNGKWSTNLDPNIENAGDVPHITIL